MYYCYDKISKEFPISAFANMCKNILDVISCKKFHQNVQFAKKKRLHFNALYTKKDFSKCLGKKFKYSVSSESAYFEGSL